jgi:hypothetical protein
MTLTTRDVARMKATADRLSLWGRVDDTVVIYNRSDHQQNEQQTITLSAWDGTESFTIGWGANDSVPIVRGTNATATAIKSAIEGITGFAGTVSVSGTTDAGPFLVTFGGSYADTDVALLTLGNFSGNNGGTVTQTIQGTSGNADRYGNPVDVWDAGTTVTAYIVPNTAEEDNLDRETGVSTFTIHVPSDTTVSRDSEVVWDGQRMRILGVPAVFWNHGTPHIEFVAEWIEG